MSGCLDAWTSGRRALFVSMLHFILVRISWIGIEYGLIVTFSQEPAVCAFRLQASSKDVVCTWFPLYSKQRPEFE